MQSGLVLLCALREQQPSSASIATDVQVCWAQQQASSSTEERSVH